MSKVKIVSWNVNGIRAAERKGFLDWLAKEPGEVVGVQETKAWPEQLSTALLKPGKYEAYWTQAEKKGYSGVATFTKLPIIGETRHGFDDHYYDSDGRVVVTEFENFVLFNIYYPNGKRGPEHVERKIKFYQRFVEDAADYRAKGKPVVCIGDFNTAYQEIDLARPKENERVSGFLPEEREALGVLFEAGFIDTFRYLHPDTVKYSWWDQKSRARERNVGWRIDYCLASEELRDNIVDATIDDEILGSDHCPITLTLDL